MYKDFPGSVSLDPSSTTSTKVTSSGGVKKNRQQLGANSTRDPLSSRSTETDDESIARCFYMLLDQITRLELKRLADKIARTPTYEESLNIVDKAFEIIDKHLDCDDDDDDYFYLYYILDADDNIIRLFELSDIAFTQNGIENLCNDIPWRERVREWLTINPIYPSHMLPAAVELAMQLGALDDHSVFETQIEKYVERHYSDDWSK